MEDYDLWAKMAVKKCKMMNVEKVFCKVRTGEKMYKRRSGINQIKKVVEIEKKLLEYKIINKVEFVFNVIVRSLFAMVPVRLKKFCYRKIVRRV